MPTLAGWIGGVRVLADLAGISTDAYLADPMRGVIRAATALDADGMIQPAVPRSLDQIRTGSVVEADHAGIAPEALLARADSLPDSESEILASFDAAAEEARYRDYFETGVSRLGGDRADPQLLGDRRALPAVHRVRLHRLPDGLRAVSGGGGQDLVGQEPALSRARQDPRCKLYQDYDLVPLMFCGEDLCNNKGPMVSPSVPAPALLPHREDDHRAAGGCRRAPDPPLRRRRAARGG